MKYEYSLKNDYSVEEREKLKQYMDENGWIDITVIQPKKYTNVLVSNGSSTFLCRYSYNNRLYYQTGERFNHAETISHWQPKPLLPQPKTIIKYE